MNDIIYIGKSDPAYPEKLRDLPGMPCGLYVKGKLPDPDKKAVAVVGARSCTPYGRRTAGDFASRLAAAGVQIISGMALGIDSCAHEGALEAGGATFAVLGCGADICYPRSNAKLYRRIAQTGGIISEFECGSPPLAYHFPIRNRIISALSDIVLVVEARTNSGSLITADYALEQGKSIYALPGRLSDQCSEGCNRLIYNGAAPAISCEHILEELGISTKKEKGSPSLPDDLCEADRQLLSLFNDSALNLENLLSRSALSLPELTMRLVKLELSGVISQISPGLYIVSYS